MLLVAAYFDGEFLLLPKLLKLFNCVIASATSAPESFRFTVVAPPLGWNSDVMLNCSTVMLICEFDDTRSSDGLGVRKAEKNWQSWEVRRCRSDIRSEQKHNYAKPNRECISILGYVSFTSSHPSITHNTYEK